jgi:hypothetical protein
LATKASSNDARFPSVDQKKAMDNAPNTATATNPFTDKQYVDTAASGAQSAAESYADGHFLSKTGATLGHIPVANSTGDVIMLDALIAGSNISITTDPSTGAKTIDSTSVATSITEANKAIIDQLTGNDATGVVGDLSKPFLTYNNSAATIGLLDPAPSTSNPFLIYYTAGEHNEANVVLKPYISISGASYVASRVVSSASLLVGSTFDTNSCRIAIEKVMLAGMSLSLDMRDVGGTAGAEFNFNAAYVNGLVYLTGRTNAGVGNDSLDTFNFFNTPITGDITVDGGHFNMLSCPEKAGYVTIEATVANTVSTIKDCSIQSMMLRGSVSGVTNNVTVIGTTIPGSITISGTTVTLKIDAASYPTGGIILSGGATISQIVYLNTSTNTKNLSSVSGNDVTDALNTLKSSSPDIKEANISIVDQIYGSDTTGIVGDRAKPFATYNGMVSAINLLPIPSQPSSSNPFVAYYSAGAHSEPTILLQPNIHICGASKYATRITSQDGYIGLGADCMTIDGRISLSNISIAGSHLSLDFNTLGGAAFTIVEVFNSYCNGLVTFTPRDGRDRFAINSSTTTGDITTKGSTVTITNCNAIGGSLLMDDTFATALTTVNGSLIPTAVVTGANATLTADIGSLSQMSATTYSGAIVTSVSLRNGTTCTTQALGDNTTKLASTAFLTGQKGVANGLATLDATIRIPTSQLPPGFTGDFSYQGVWDASTGVYPTGAVAAQYWITNVAGTISGTAYLVGDWMVYNGTGWDKVDNADVMATLSVWTGSTNLTTLGIITTGTWDADVISSSKGGAGAINGILKADGLGNVSPASAGTDYLAPTGNGSGLTGLTKTQVGLGNVTNDVQTKASIVPNTVPTVGQLMIGNAGGTAYSPSSFRANVVTVSSNGQTSFANAYSVTPLIVVDVVRNGIVYAQNGVDFSVSGTTLTWLNPAGVTTATTDTLLVRYFG